jgi:hypothetical protein
MASDIASNASIVVTAVLEGVVGLVDEDRLAGLVLEKDVVGGGVRGGSDVEEVTLVLIEVEESVSNDLAVASGGTGPGGGAIRGA